MKYFAVPYGLSTLLVFCAPADKPGTVNNIWLAVCLWAYFLFYTLYMIPHNALLPEMIPDMEKRMNAYTTNSMFFCNRQCAWLHNTAYRKRFQKSGAFAA